MSRSLGSLRNLSRPRLPLALAIVAITCTFSASSFAQRRGGRGAASRDAAPAAADRGQAGYGAVGNASRPAGATGEAAGTASDKTGPVQFPTRRTDSAGGAVAEYQKPTYSHHHFAVSPDGRRMAVSGSHVAKESTSRDQPEKLKRDASGKPIVQGHVLEVIDVASGRPLVAFKPPMPFENMALSADSRFLAAEAPDRPGVVFVLHLPTRKSKEFKTDLRRILYGGIVFSPDNRSIHVVAPDRMKTVSLATGESKELAYEFTNPAASYCAALNVVAVGVSRSRHGKPEVHIYDVASGKQTQQLAVPAGPNCLQFSADGKYLAATVSGGAVGVWHTSDWSAVGSSAARIAAEPGQLAVSSDGQRVAVRPRTLGRDLTRVIEVSDGHEVQSIASRDVFFLPGGSLAVAGADGPYYLNLSTGLLAELPEGGVGDTGLAQSATSPFGDLSGQSRDAAPTNSQPGYGAASVQPTNTQPGYGTVADQPANEQPGYGVVTPQPTDGQAAPAPAASPPPASGGSGRR